MDIPCRWQYWLLSSRQWLLIKVTDYLGGNSRRKTKNYLEYQIKNETKYELHNEKAGEKGENKSEIKANAQFTDK